MEDQQVRGRLDSNARSTKTRIETNRLVGDLMADEIRMQDPLKQGLKLENAVMLA